MAPITERMIRQRAEHNEGMLSTLEEVALHQQNIEKIELLQQLCPRLKILYLQNNLISKIQNLHKLKDLTYINLAVNNISKIENLQRVESLAKLDLTINFVPKAGLLSLESLAGLTHLKELTLMGNPCADWHGYRHFVIATLPHLKRLDGVDIKHSERIAAQQQLAELQGVLRGELLAEGIDPEVWLKVEDDSVEYDENGEVKETGTMDENGEMKRPWCPATRILEHRENERIEREAREKKSAEQDKQRALNDLLDGPAKTTRLDEFPPLPEGGERVMQRNDGRWDFSMEESDDGSAIVLEVDVGKFLDTSLIKADVQPTFVRLLIKGKLLLLCLPCEVRPDASGAQRSQATGRLVLTMPKENPAAEVNVAHIRPKDPTSSGTASTSSRAAAAAKPAAFVSGGGRGGTGSGAGGPSKGSSGGLARKPGESRDDFIIRESRKPVVAAVSVVEGDDDDYIPAL